jgi:hypothetical protein
VWNVEITDEFEAWFGTLAPQQQDAVVRSILVLEEGGPGLGRPHVDTIKGSKLQNLKELRAQCSGSPLRMFFVFDPRRSAILLIGGDKTGDKRFYERMIPIAEALYERYLAELRKEGKLPWQDTRTGEY